MRRWLLITLVLLLSVRGWVGDAMAGEMIASRLAAVSHGPAVTAVHGAPHDVHDAHAEMAEPDCHGAMLAALPPAAEDAAPDQPAADHTECPTCSACQICSAVGVLLPVAPRVLAAVAQPVPVSRPAVIASIAPATLFKPPIS